MQATTFKLGLSLDGLELNLLPAHPKQESSLKAGCLEIAEGAMDLKDSKLTELITDEMDSFKKTWWWLENRLIIFGKQMLRDIVISIYRRAFDVGKGKAIFGKDPN